MKRGGGVILGTSSESSGWDCVCALGPSEFSGTGMRLIGLVVVLKNVRIRVSSDEFEGVETTLSKIAGDKDSPKCSQTVTELTVSLFATTEQLGCPCTEHGTVPMNNKEPTFCTLAEVKARILFPT